MTIQGAIAELQNLLKVDDVPCYYKSGIQKVIETIQMDAQPKRGEWVRYMGDIWTCSACGESLMCDDIECNNYCPNCGAKMTDSENPNNCERKE